MVSRTGRKRKAPRKTTVAVLTKDDFRTQFRRAIVPKTVSTILTYATKFNLTSVAGAIFQQIFRGNSIFDPDQTGAGHQPRGFDQLATLYGRYKVFRSKLEVMAVTSNNDNGGCMEITIIPTIDNSTFTGEDPERLIEIPGAKMITLAPGVESMTEISMTTAGIYGVPRSVVNTDDLYSAVITTNPVRQWYWGIAAQVSDGISTMDAHMYTKLTYHVTLFAPKFQSQS